MDDAERQRIGEGFAVTNHVGHKLIRLEEGHRQGAQAARDIENPRRLRNLGICLLLMRTGPAGLRSLAVDSCQPAEPALWKRDRGEDRGASAESDRSARPAGARDNGAGRPPARVGNGARFRSVRRAGRAICDWLRYDRERRFVLDGGRKQALRARPAPVRTEIACVSMASNPGPSVRTTDRPAMGESACADG